jgi:CheY-like chemotaxis protein
MVLAAFLQKKKYPFTKAVNGLLGVQAVMASPETFDVILMGTTYRCLLLLCVERVLNTIFTPDMQMPVMSGFEAIRAIRKLEAENIGTMKRSLIIALTGLASSGDTDEAYGAGADLFLTKPVPFKIVDRELEKWKERANKIAAIVTTPINSVLRLLSTV